MSKTIEKLSNEFIARFARDLYHCSSCNYCVDAVWPERGMQGVCATMEQHSRAPGYSGRGYIEAARAILEGQAMDGAALAERVFTCTTCGNCETVCPLGLRPASVGRALREQLLDHDCLPPTLVTARDAFLEDGNPYGLPRAQRHAWARDLADDGPPVDLSLFVGCAGALALEDEARASVALLRAAGLRLELAKEGCCGAPLGEIGLRRESEALARAISTRLSQREVLIIGCECRSQLQAAGLATRSWAQWLCDAHAHGTVQLHRIEHAMLPPTVQLLESCQLKADSRRGDEAAVAALLIALGVTVVNRDFPNHHAACCGAGGGMPAMAPASAARMARTHLPPSGVAVTLDARCASHMRACAEEGVEVLGLASFIERYFTLDKAQQ